MIIKIAHWQAVIGIFNCRSSAMPSLKFNLTKNFVTLFEVLLFCWHYFESAFIFLLTLVYIIYPGSKKQKTSNLSVCHWNLNSLPAHSFLKLTQLKAYNSIYKYDFTCLSETYLDSSTPDNLIEIEGYKLIRADHTDNIKRGGVCIYYKESLCVRVISTPYLEEALLLEMDYNNKKVMICHLLFP